MSATEDRARFEALVRQYGAELYRYAYWLCRERQRAEDTMQEALLRAWRAFPGVRDAHSARAWLYAIVRNEFNRDAAWHAARPTTVDIDEVELSDERDGLFGATTRDALAALPAAYAEPLTLQVLGGFSCAEIATMMSISEGAVMTRLSRARQALRRALHPARASLRRGAL